MEQILAAPWLDLVALADLDPDGPDVEEAGRSYDENALIKARAAVAATGLPAIADDAGLEIDALDGQPGVHSHRFLGQDTPFPEKMRQILTLLGNVPEEKRACRFRAAVALVLPTGEEYLCHGVCEGRVAHEQRGTYGFGYDPIFYLPQLGRHMAELPPEEKHRISHRGQALACVRKLLEQLFLNR